MCCLHSTVRNARSRRLSLKEFHNCFKGIFSGFLCTLFNMVHLLPLRFHCVRRILGSNPEEIRLWHLQSARSHSQFLHTYSSTKVKKEPIPQRPQLQETKQGILNWKYESLILSSLFIFCFSSPEKKYWWLKSIIFVCYTSTCYTEKQLTEKFDILNGCHRTIARLPWLTRKFVAGDEKLSFDTSNQDVELFHQNYCDEWDGKMF